MADVDAATAADAVDVLESDADLTTELDVQSPPQLVVDDPLCAEQWCWYHPLPQGNALHDVWRSALDAVWAVGDAGTSIRWDGESWTQAPSGTRESLHALWGSSANDVWALGIQHKFDSATRTKCL